MKRVLLIIAVALVVPSILAAAPITVGVYYEGGLTCTPPPNLPEQMPVVFEMALYMVQNEYEMTALEYRLEVMDGQEPPQPSGLFSIQEVILPDAGQAEMGSPMAGHSITFWPPLNGLETGYNLLVTYECIIFGLCEEIVNQNTTIEVVAHPDTDCLRGTKLGGEKIELIGLKTYLCPEGIATEEQSWGAIKAMYR